MRALVLSAGFGTRLRPYTEIYAKPAIPFLNIPMIGFPLYACKQAGVGQIGVNLHHLPETVKSACKGFETDFEFQFFEEQPDILDSGGGIKNAEKFLSQSNDFWVLNGDTVCLFEDFEFLDEMRRLHTQSNAIATILVCPFPEDQKGQGLGGIFVKEDGMTIDHFSKTDRGSGLTPYHYIGVCIYSNRIFDYLPLGKPSNIFYDGVTRAMAEGETAKVMIHNKNCWLETGNPADFLTANNVCLRGVSEPDSLYNSHLSGLLNWKTPNWRQHFHQGNDSVLLASADTLLPEGFSWTGYNSIAPACSIAGPCAINDVVMLPGASITAGGDLSSKIILPQ